MGSSMLLPALVLIVAAGFLLLNRAWFVDMARERHRETGLAGGRFPSGRYGRAVATGLVAYYLPPALPFSSTRRMSACPRAGPMRQ